MQRDLTARAVLIGTAALILPPLAAAAQEGGGLRFTLGIEERIEAIRNPDLDIPATGTTTSATTRLSFGMVSETAIQTFSLNAAAGVRIANEPADGTTTELEAPSLSVNYQRAVSNAALTFGINFRRDRIDTLDASDFPDDLPDDLADLDGTGTREDLTAQASLAWGMDAPLGVTLTATAGKTTYTDASDPDLIDNTRYGLTALTRLRFSPVLDGTVLLSHSVEDEDVVGGVRTETQSLRFGLDYALSPAAQMKASLGLSQSDENGVDSDGISASVGYTQELASGQFGAEIGVVKGEDDTALTGRLDWRQDFATSQFSASLLREASTDATDITTTARVGYDYEINDVSGLSLGVALSQIDEAGENAVQRTDLTASYRRALTEDWNMDFGVNHRIRDEETVGTTSSQAIFVALRRDFEW